jgi:ABC-type glycerol-3-phosphate transport system permease component
MEKIRHLAPPVLNNLVVWLAVIFFVFPTLWTYMTAFKPPAEYYRSPPQLLPEQPTIYHFYEAFFPEAIEGSYDEAQAYWVEEAAGRANPVTPALVNSLGITFGATVLSLLIGIPAAYALSRYRFKGGKDMAVWLLSTRMVPPIVMVIPLFFIMNSLRLIDTWLGLIIMYIMINLPIVVWILKGVFDDVPRELEDAALVDGCTRATAFTRVVLPLAIGGIIAAALFCVFLTWNEFLFALIMTRKEAVTLPVALSTFRQDRGLLWGMMSATIIVATLPVIAIVFVLQRRVVQGLLTGSSK